MSEITGATRSDGVIHGNVFNKLQSNFPKAKTTQKLEPRRWGCPETGPAPATQGPKTEGPQNWGPCKGPQSKRRHLLRHVKRLLRCAQGQLTLGAGQHSHSSGLLGWQQSRLLPRLARPFPVLVISDLLYVRLEKVEGGRWKRGVVRKYSSSASLEGYMYARPRSRVDKFDDVWDSEFASEAVISGIAQYQCDLWMRKPLRFVLCPANKSTLAKASTYAKVRRHLAWHCIPPAKMPLLTLI